MLFDWFAIMIPEHELTKHQNNWHVLCRLPGLHQCGRDLRVKDIQSIEADMQSRLTATCWTPGRLQALRRYPWQRPGYAGLGHAGALPRMGD